MRLISIMPVRLVVSSEPPNRGGNTPVEGEIHKSVRVHLRRPPALRRLYNRAEIRAPPRFPNAPNW